jgi:hypothetical protein
MTPPSWQSAVATKLILCSLSFVGRMSSVARYRMDFTVSWRWVTLTFLQMAHQSLEGCRSYIRIGIGGKMLLLYSRRIP